MANNYLQFSAVIEHLTAEERQWLADQLEIVDLFGAREYPEGAAPAELAGVEPDWSGCRVYRDMEEVAQETWPVDAGFEYAFYDNEDNRYDEGDGVHLHLYSEEWGYVDRVAHLVRKFLAKFRPNDCWSMTWAITCSKPRVGEFTGGAVFVTAKEALWNYPDEFIEEQREAFLESQKGSS